MRYDGLLFRNRQEQMIDLPSASDVGQPHAFTRNLCLTGSELGASSQGRQDGENLEVIVPVNSGRGEYNFSQCKVINIFKSTDTALALSWSWVYALRKAALELQKRTQTIGDIA